jgi:REP element-mobilizing transposase RayT
MESVCRFVLLRTPSEQLFPFRSPLFANRISLRISANILFFHGENSKEERMRYDPLIHHRRSIRLRGYDYAEAGMYFLTLTTHARRRIFGEIIANEMHLSAFGEIVQDEWLHTPIVRPETELDEFVIMPDHFHAILFIRPERNGVLRQGVSPYAPTRLFSDQVTPFRSPSHTVGAVVRGFKGVATKRINELRQTPGLPVWQRNFHDHIIRSGNELDRIREYIRKNAEEWTLREDYS